jgi:hypothetical protein
LDARLATVCGFTAIDILHKTEIYKERMRHTQRKKEKRKEWIHAVLTVVPCHKIKKLQKST